MLPNSVKQTKKIPSQDSLVLLLDHSQLFTMFTNHTLALHFPATFSLRNSPLRTDKTVIKVVLLLFINEYKQQTCFALMLSWSGMNPELHLQKKKKEKQRQKKAKKQQTTTKKQKKTNKKKHTNKNEQTE